MWNEEGGEELKKKENAMRQMVCDHATQTQGFDASFYFQLVALLRLGRYIFFFLFLQLYCTH